MSHRETILKLFHEVVAESGGTVVPDLNDETVLLESGLDSLGFAILVSRLDEDLGFDPFSAAADAYYPATLGEFVAFYDAYKAA